jgi:hypothetical protein
MFTVTRPISRTYHHVQDEVLELRCHRCGRRFRSLQECYLCYPPPSPGARSEARCCHRKCAEGEAQLRLMRSDFALRQVLTPLVTPAIPVAALQDEPRTRGRQDWSDDA